MDKRSLPQAHYRELLPYWETHQELKKELIGFFIGFPIMCLFGYIMALSAWPY